MEITLSDLETKIEQYNLLDVREDYEREHYNIGGQHIPLGQLADRFAEVSQEKDLVVYCKAGVRSKMAIDILKHKGFAKPLVNLKNGVFGY